MKLHDVLYWYYVVQIPQFQQKKIETRSKFVLETVEGGGGFKFKINYPAHSRNKIAKQVGYACFMLIVHQIQGMGTCMQPNNCRPEQPKI